RKPDTPNAVGHRGAAYSLGLLAAVDPAAVKQTHLPRRELLTPFSDHILGPSLNFSFGPIEEHDIRAAFEQADYRRLARLRAEYDPRKLLPPHPAIPDVSG